MQEPGLRITPKQNTACSNGPLELKKSRSTSPKSFTVKHMKCITLTIHTVQQ